ncbi:MAG: hypothetical protein AAGB46_00615 [Verrucomicrobiota bacterium]
MFRVIAVLLVSLFGASGWTRPAFVEEWEPSAQDVAEHRREVFVVARNYIEDTFNLVILDESNFNPVRFNSTGVWGDFEARLKELGDDRYEVQGWVQAKGLDDDRIFWSVVVSSPVVDPNAWKYRRLDAEYRDDPEVTSWRFGAFHSVPYDADYSEEYIAKLERRSGRKTNAR